MSFLCGCCRNTYDGRDREVPAVALWTGPNNFTVALCQSCLDIWFDNADYDAEDGELTEMEPRRVQWLDGTRTLVAA